MSLPIGNFISNKCISAGCTRNCSECTGNHKRICYQSCYWTDIWIQSKLCLNSYPSRFTHFLILLQPWLTVQQNFIVTSRYVLKLQLVMEKTPLLFLLSFMQVKCSLCVDQSIFNQDKKKLHALNHPFECKSWNQNSR